MVPNEAKLLDMLSNNDVTFFIPPYQRNYEWTDEQCKVFLDDVIRTADRNCSGRNSEHFFGSVTYFQNETPFGQPNRLVLIDGQQRITTTMLFLVALRDRITDAGLKNFIDSKYLKNNNAPGDVEYKIKLKQVETDWVAYKKIILGEELTDKEKDSAVFRNFKYFFNKLSELEEKGIDISGLVEKGLNKFSVITIELQPTKNEWENPQEIFESMNSLGKPLSLADLVRNYLLLGMPAEKQSELYAKYWLHMEKVIPKQVSNFVRDYMQGIEARSFPKATDNNHKELYSLFKRIFENADATGLLKDLSLKADIYSAILPGGTTGINSIDCELQDLNRINVTTAYSFILMLLTAWKNNEFSTNDIATILNAFKIYCLRRRLIGLGMAENKNFPTLVNEIPKLVKASDKRTCMFEILSKQEHHLRLPNDIELTRFIETMNFYNFSYCKFFLALVEEKITKSRPDLNDKKLQIEHIMPKTLNDVWKEELGDNYETVHQELVHTIGNLTLIRHNQELGQKKFSDKKDVYENNAGLQIAKTEITNRKHWGSKEIKARTKWLTNYLLENVMPIPDKMRKVNNFSLKESRSLSFLELQLVGLDINFIDDPTIIAHVVGDKEVEFEGKKWRLSPLTKEIQTRRGTVNASGAYQGARYWEYEGIRLADVMIISETNKEKEQ